MVIEWFALLVAGAEFLQRGGGIVQAVGPLDPQRSSRAPWRDDCSSLREEREREAGASPP
jgi:hypothetical protein